ncbi:hypothetical protein BGX29_002621, partial [Mortierella sp. GBA35]
LHPNNPRPVVRRDPCTVLPTEVWHQILSCLPLSAIAQTSIVSKTWLDEARFHPIWSQICQGGLGEPTDVYKTHMVLACANSYWFCNGCRSLSKGYPHESHIPIQFVLLPKIDNNKKGCDPVLCHKCRLQSRYLTCISNNPYEYLPLANESRLSSVQAREVYFLTKDLQLCRIGVYSDPNFEAIRRGWVKKRRERFKSRAEPLQKATKAERARLKAVEVMCCFMQLPFFIDDLRRIKCVARDHNRDDAPAALEEIAPVVLEA